MSARMERLGRAMLIMFAVLILALLITRLERAVEQGHAQESRIPSLQELRMQEPQVLPEDLQRYLFDTEDFQLLGLSPQERILSFSCQLTSDFACMQVDQGLLRAGWQRLPQGTEGLLCYSREPLDLQGDWAGCSFLLVMVFENADGCSLVLQFE